MSEQAPGGPKPVTISRDEYERSRAAGNAGTLRGARWMTRLTKDAWQGIGADGWQVAWEEGTGTVLRPVRIADAVSEGQ